MKDYSKAHRVRERKIIPGTYDGFFRSRTRVTVVQFVGLLIIGGTLICGAIITLCVFILRFWGQGSSGIAIICLVVAMMLPIMYYGFMHIRRAYRGRR
jgi:hypothetical protein